MRGSPTCSQKLGTRFKGVAYELSYKGAARKSLPQSLNSGGRKEDYYEEDQINDPKGKGDGGGQRGGVFGDDEEKVGDGTGWENWCAAGLTQGEIKGTTQEFLGCPQWEDCRKREDTGDSKK